jgi:hypothetical protein
MNAQQLQALFEKLTATVPQEYLPRPKSHRGEAQDLPPSSFYKLSEAQRTAARKEMLEGEKTLLLCAHDDRAFLIERINRDGWPGIRIRSTVIASTATPLPPEAPQPAAPAQQPGKAPAPSHVPLGIPKKALLLAGMGLVGAVMVIIMFAVLWPTWAVGEKPSAPPKQGPAVAEKRKEQDNNAAAEYVQDLLRKELQTIVRAEMKLLVQNLAGVKEQLDSVESGLNTLTKKVIAANTHLTKIQAEVDGSKVAIANLKTMIDKSDEKGFTTVQKEQMRSELQYALKQELPHWVYLHYDQVLSTELGEKWVHRLVRLKK